MGTGETHSAVIDEVLELLAQAIAADVQSDNERLSDSIDLSIRLPLYEIGIVDKITPVSHSQEFKLAEPSRD